MVVLSSDEEADEADEAEHGLRPRFHQSGKDYSTVQVDTTTAEVS